MQCSVEMKAGQWAHQCKEKRALCYKERRPLPAARC